MTDKDQDKDSGKNIYTHKKPTPALMSKNMEFGARWCWWWDGGGGGGRGTSSRVRREDKDGVDSLEFQKAHKISVNNTHQLEWVDVKLELESWTSTVARAP